MPKNITVTIPFDYSEFEKSICSFLKNIRENDLNFKNEEMTIVVGDQLKVADPIDALREMLLLELVKAHLAELQQGSDFSPLC